MRKSLRLHLFICFIVWFLTSIPSHAQVDRQLPSSQAEVQLSYSPVVQKTAPAVVNIYTAKLVKQRVFSPFMSDPFFRFFFGEQVPQGHATKRYENSLGSGVIVKPDGTIVTSHHVIEGADEITVVLSDRREFAAKVLLSDERTDLAVLKIDTQGEVMPFLEMRDSDSVEVGDLVLAIGNPFGVGQSVTTGIVSAQARTNLNINDLNYYIQTDAAINPGNSGGALVGMDGRLIGINAAIYTRDGGNMGLGFAVPANMVRATLSNVARGDRHIIRPWAGIDGQAVTSDMAKSLGLSYPMGLLVNKVHKASPAYKKGLKVGDLITSVNGKMIDDPASFAYRMATLPTMDEVVLGVMRQKKKYTLAFKLIPPPEVPKRNERIIRGHNPLGGATIANLSPAVAAEYNFRGQETGVVVLELMPNSIARRLGVRNGDIILRLNSKNIKRVRDVAELIDDRESVRWNMLLERDGQKIAVRVGR